VFSHVTPLGKLFPTVGTLVGFVTVVEAEVGCEGGLEAKVHGANCAVIVQESQMNRLDVRYETGPGNIHLMNSLVLTIFLC
jgi:hypothetical protein